MVSKKAISLVESVLNEGRYHDNAIQKAESSEYNLEAAIKANDVKKVKKLIAKFTKAKEYIKEARTKKYTGGKGYWEAPEWILAILLGPSALGIGLVSFLSSKKTRFNADELEKMEETLDQLIEKANNFLLKTVSAKQEAAYNLVNQVLNEGRYHDKSITKANLAADYDLDKAISEDDVKKVKQLRNQYLRALDYIKEARSNKYVASGNYWELPQWLLFLLAPWPISVPIISYTSSKKTKFSTSDLDKIEGVLKKAVDKCDEYLDSDVKQEAATLVNNVLKSIIK